MCCSGIFNFIVWFQNDLLVKKIIAGDACHSQIKLFTAAYKVQSTAISIFIRTQTPSWEAAVWDRVEPFGGFVGLLSFMCNNSGSEKKVVFWDKWSWQEIQPQVLVMEAKRIENVMIPGWTNRPFRWVWKTRRLDCGANEPTIYMLRIQSRKPGEGGDVNQ